MVLDMQRCTICADMRRSVNVARAVKGAGRARRIRGGKICVHEEQIPELRHDATGHACSSKVRAIACLRGYLCLPLQRRRDPHEREGKEGSWGGRRAGPGARRYEHRQYDFARKIVQGRRALHHTLRILEQVTVDGITLGVPEGIDLAGLVLAPAHAAAQGRCAWVREDGRKTRSNACGGCIPDRPSHEATRHRLCNASKSEAANAGRGRPRTRSECAPILGLCVAMLVEQGPRSPQDE